MSTPGILPGGVVAVPVTVAAKLIRLPGFRACRVQARGTRDYAAWHGLYLAGMSVPGNGTTAVPMAAAVPSWITTQQAAEILQVSPRAVTKQLTAGHLAGRKNGGRWEVDRTSLEARIQGRHAA